MHSTRGKLLASLGAIVTIAGAGTYGTFAAFTGTTEVNGNSFAAGTLDISKGAGVVSPAFELSNRRPGDTTDAKCVTVTNTGTLSYASLKLSAVVGGTGLADYLTVDVDRGTGAAGGDGFSCSGFSQTDADIVSGLLKDFPTAASPITETGWAAGTSKSYRITVTLPSAVADADAEGRTATVSLRWDASS